MSSKKAAAMLVVFISKLKGKVSDETYDKGIKLFNEFKNKFRN